jgi:AraC-like DNA-binding protein
MGRRPRRMRDRPIVAVWTRSTICCVVSAPTAPASNVTSCQGRLSGTYDAGGTGLTLCMLLRGEARLSHGETVRAGDIAVLRGAGAMAGDATVLVGTYDVRGAVSRRLLDVLPPVLVVPDEHGCEQHRDFLDAQVGQPGAQVVLDRLLDWLLVCTLREWFDQPEAVPPGWFRALGDDAVGLALRAMHAAPERPWTLADLAREAGVSRTTLAARFAKLVGTPPLTYLTDWRMALAADLLTESTATVAAVARQVGYADAFSFSAAFKRRHGMSPTEHRRPA